MPPNSRPPMCSSQTSESLEALLEKNWLSPQGDAQGEPDPGLSHFLSFQEPLMVQKWYQSDGWWQSPHFLRELHTPEQIFPPLVDSGHTLELCIQHPKKKKQGASGDSSSFPESYTANKFSRVLFCTQDWPGQPSCRPTIGRKTFLG